MRGLKAAGGVLAIVLVLSACIKVDGTIKIEDDGSGSVDFLTVLNTGALGSVLGDFDIPEGELGSSEELCAGFEEEFTDTDGLPANAVVTPYEEDGFCGSRIQYPLTASLDQSAQIEDLFDETTRLYKEGNNWFFETGFNADDITSEAEGAPPGMMDALFGDASFRITVDLPGRAVVGENNATEVGNDGKFTWDIDLFNAPTRLFAQTEPGSGGGSGGGGGLSPIIIGIVVVAVLAAGGFFFLKQRNERSGAGEPGSGGEPLVDSLPGAPSVAPAPVAPGEMPLGDGPPVAVMPTQVMPASEAAKETVVMNPADAQRLVEEASASAAGASDDSAAAASSTPQPVFDEDLGAWVVDDPARGRLRHDPATDTWNPV